jgi:UDPglucose 6-dehydrogenase
MAPTDHRGSSLTPVRVAVVGLGKLGAPLAAVLASSGNDVLGVDVNPETVRLVNEGLAPVEEPGLQELITAARDRITATTDPASAAATDVAILLVPTPSDERGAFATEYLLAALEQLGSGFGTKDDYRVVVVGSTVMPGSCDGEIRSTLERASGRVIGESLGLCYSPEFIALGNVIRDMREPDMVLIGESDARAGEIVERLYEKVVENDPPFRRMSLINAELTKIAVNTYVTMKISYANVLADICERLPEADVDVVTDALGLDTRIGGKYLRGAIAYGGPCFPRDNKAFATLARDVGAQALLAEATDAVNVAQSDRLARIVQSHLAEGCAVGILGLSYKPHTNVIEESAGVALAGVLAQAGYHVRVYDPVATDAAVAALGGVAHGARSAAELLEQSDVVVIATPWPEFAELSLNGDGERPVIIDCWGVFRSSDSGNVIRLGRALVQKTPSGTVA